jgi:hypothetical protein
VHIRQHGNRGHHVRDTTEAAFVSRRKLAARSPSRSFGQ